MEKKAKLVDLNTRISKKTGNTYIEALIKIDNQMLKCLVDREAEDLSSFVGKEGKAYFNISIWNMVGSVSLSDFK